MAERRDSVAIQVSDHSLGLEHRVGKLTRQRSGSGSVFSFAYSPEWLEDPIGFQIDPVLPLFEGEQFHDRLPGVFADASPDRWGRTLLERREALQARNARRQARNLDEWDFLCGVNDHTRLGAIRLRLPGTDTYIDDMPLAVPPSTRLRELEQIARDVEEGLPQSGTEAERWLSMLLAPGSSLGGARPKANFTDRDGSLWIAKFPSQRDRHDVGAWEGLTARLAGRAGVRIPETRVLRLGSPEHTFCSRRFDRDGKERRLYASAMTLTGHRDGDDASYLDIAQAVVRFGAADSIKEDLAQLFRRLVFNVMVANRDDHLRNHGFLRSPGGWRLGPAFDLNPDPEKEEHSLAIDDRLRFPDLDLVRETAAHYRLAASESERIIDEVSAALADWRQEARRAGLPGDQVERLAAAFLV